MCGRWAGVRVWIGILAFAKAVCVILASTHWIVTEEGFIQPILDSPFHLKEPSDLLAFLEQENRLSDIHAIYQHFVERKIILARSLVYSLNEAQFIPKKYKTNENCLRAKNKKLKDVDLSISFTSDGSDRKGVEMKHFFPNESLSELQGSDVPDCQTLFTLPFSMHTFEHLQSMKERHNLTVPVEASLHEWLAPGMSIEAFGHQLYHALLQNSTSWLHYNLASVFWRISGHASNALECSRRAVYLVPRQYKDVALLNMGAVLYRAERYTDAAIMFHAAVDHAPFAAINHFILANTYANIAEFDKAAACYNNVIALKPSCELAHTNQNMMLCYAFRVMEILEIHNSIQEMRKAFEEYQEIFGKWQATGIKALNLQSSLSLKMIDNPNVDFTTKENSEKNNYQSGIADKKIFKYSLLQNHDMFSTDLFGMLQASSNLYKVVDSFQNQINEISNSYELSEDYLLLTKSQNGLPPVLENILRDGFDDIKSEASDDSVIVVSLLKTFKKADSNVDSSPPETDVNLLEDELVLKYPKDKMKVSRVKFDFDRNSDWPSMEECEAWSLTNSKLIDLKGNCRPFPLYLPVENKGYNVSKILSDYIKIDLRVEHPLPWHPPTCPSRSLSNVDYLPDELRVKAKQLPQFSHEDEDILLDTLVNSVFGDLDSAKHHQAAEIGHRIYMAMKMNVAPKWVLYSLGSLYWRMKSNVPNTLDCLTSALEDVPCEVKDVPLTSLASVLFDLGYGDDAFKIAFEAHNINMYEPATNFLLSLIHNRKNINQGQMFHMKQVVRIDENFMFGKAYQLLRAWSCQAKFSPSSQEDSSNTDGSARSANVHVLSEQGTILSMLCTTMWMEQSCHPVNVFISEIEDDIRSVREDGIIPLTISEEMPISKVYESSVELFAKTAIRINIVLEDSLFKISFPLLQFKESSLETKEGKIFSKSEITASDSYVIDKNGYWKEMGKFSIMVHRNSNPEFSHEILEWFVNGKQLLYHMSKESCTKLKPTENVLFSKQLWNLFQNRFPTLNQILTPFDTVGTLEPKCSVSESLTPESDVIRWYVKTVQKSQVRTPNEKVLKVLRKLMGGTTALVDEIGAMIAEAMLEHEESWILKVLAGVYYSVKGNSHSAITCMKQALSLAPENDKDVPLLGLSALYYWLDSPHDAVVYSKFAYEIHPNFPAGPFFIGFILALAKRESEAFVMFRKAYAIDPDLTIIEDIVKYIACSMKTGGRFMIKSC